MKQVVAIALLAGSVAGMTREPDAAAPPPATLSAPADRGAEARAFPLTGRWRYADTAGLLPRGSSCEPQDPALTLTAHGATLVHGSWRQPVVSFADWRLKNTTDLELTVVSSGSALLERARLTLDLRSAGFVRFRAAAAPDGTALAARAPLPAGYDRGGAEAEIARIAGAFTLIRCPDPTLDPVALLRGATEAPAPTAPPHPTQRNRPPR